MKVAGSAVRLTVYIVLIIMGVLAIVVPPALEDYWFEGDMQRNFEGIAEALDNPFGREALLTMGVIGGAFNIAALALYTRRKKSGEKREGSAQPSALTVLGREGIADILVYGADILVCLILTGYVAQGDIFPYDTLNKLAVALALLGAFGCLVVLITLIAGGSSAADAEHVKASPSAAKSGSGQPAARAAAPAAQPPAGEAPRTSVSAAPVAPVGRQVPVAPAPRAEQSAPVRSRMLNGEFRPLNTRFLPKHPPLRRRCNLSCRHPYSPPRRRLIPLVPRRPCQEPATLTEVGMTTSAAITMRTAAITTPTAAIMPRTGTITRR